MASRDPSLRKRAEEALQKQPARPNPETLSAAEIRSLIHDLQVHQIELEMQNDELRRTQVELEAARDRYIDLYDLAPVGYLTLSEKGLINQANLTMSMLLGMARGSLARVPLSRFVVPDDQDAYYLNIRQMLKSKTRQVWELRLKGPEDRFVDVHIEGICADAGECRLIVTDISDAKKAREAMVRLERMQAFATLSGGISHNLNNILTGILGPGQLIQRNTTDAETRAMIKEVVASALRAKDLVNQLYRCTHEEKDRSIYPVSANQMVQDALFTTQPRWKNEAERLGFAIEVHTDLSDVAPVRGTELGLYNIFLNLIVNALDAMPAGGTLAISTRAADAGVQIVVADTGIGMTKEVKNRAFEPFFTTKGTVGNGLGLATVYNTVMQWGGHISLDSAPHQGATFTLWLPAWTGSVEVEASPQKALQTGRRGVLLVVESNAQVTLLLSRLLGNTHRLEIVSSGPEALERFVPGRYDVALIALSLPGMPGDQMAQQLKAKDHALATILLTGWSPDVNPMHAFDFRIQKPFGIAQLQDVVARAIALHDARG